MKLIGIDPGANGGIASLNTENDEVKCWAMPETEKDMVEMFIELVTCGYTKALIEKVHGMPGQGGAAMFTFGRGYGTVRTAMIAVGISFDEVTPQAWQKAMGIPPRKKTETKVQHKNKLKAKAQQLFPDVKVTLANADALLIVEYLRRTS